MFDTTPTSCNREPALADVAYRGQPDHGWASLNLVRPLVLVLACAVGPTACVIKQGKLRPGLFINAANSRDPDPTRNFATTPDENMWAPEGGHAPSKAGSRSELVQTATAALAVIAAGTMPSLIWSGTFDENTWFETSSGEQAPPR
jgi:hypothetical protein